MWKRRLAILLFCIVGLCVTPALGEKVVPEKDPAPDDADRKLSTELLQLADPSRLPPGLSRQALTETMQREDRYRGPGRAVRGTERPAPSEIVYVYVGLGPGVPLSTVDPFAWSVRNRDEPSRTVAAWIEVERLLMLAATPGVTQISPVLPPVTGSGSMKAESDRILLADRVRDEYGLTGAGVRIGVISDGVDHWSSAVESGNLPAELHILRNDQGGDEGTAMFEIVHDIASGAELYFHDMGENSIDFTTGVDALVDAGCTVIVDDIGWITQPFFEDGSVATHIQSLASTRDLLYLSSAGNAAQRHYQGTYRNDGSDFHDFSGGSKADYDYLYVSIPPGGSLRTVLEWDDPWTGSTNDYDLYLYDTSTWGAPIAVSDYSQDGNDTPLEVFSYRNTGASTIEGEIDVHNYAAVARTLEVYLYPANGTKLYNNNVVASDSVFGHTAAPNVVSVGAVGAADPGADTIEPFSSRGPATLRYPGAVQRMKPDVTGIDGVSVTGAGGFSNPFYGTSASAPAVAAVSALVWSGAPTRAAAQVRTALLSSCTDLGVAGPDSTFGNGRVDAVAFAQAVGLQLPISIAAIAPVTGAQGSTIEMVRLNGTGFLAGATVGLRRTGHADIAAADVVVVPLEMITCRFALPPSAAPGAWDVAVTNPDGRSATLAGGFVITPPAPLAAFTATPASGTAPLAVQFTDTSIGTGITSWSWTFGDGETSTLQDPVHTYLAAGTYAVALDISNPGGSDARVKPGFITVTDPAPAVVLVPSGAGLPTDADGGGLYEDVNGNGRADFSDVVLFFNQMSWIEANEPVTAFDFSGNDRIDFADVVALFNAL